MGQYIFGQAAMAVFAVTGVLAAIRKDRDILGLVVLGLITAVGGGTIRDVILGVPVFWIADTTYLTVSAAASAVTFFLLKISSINDARYRILLYFDALGVAFFYKNAF
ncbi:MAG: TRIC cation channel family protein [Spirochaetales bacterium]|nr:TRIC cation channel family protein [Spirochaetales bacterium]